MFSKSSLLILEEPLLWLVFTFKKLQSVKEKKNCVWNIYSECQEKAKFHLLVKQINWINKVQFCTTVSTKIHTVSHSSSLQSQYMPRNVVSSVS